MKIVSRAMWKRFTVCLIPALFFVVCWGCSQRSSIGTAGPPLRQAPRAKLVWPAPPDPSRISYVTSIYGSKDIGIKKSFFRRLGQLLFGTSEEWLVRPTGVAVKDGLLAVADPGRQALFLFDRSARRIRKITRAGGIELASPVGVTIGAKWEVYVTDSYHGRIYVYDRKGQFLHAWGEDVLARPTGVAFDARRERLYVADTVRHRIVVFDTEGKALFSFGGRGTGDGEFNWPSYLCVDGNGLLYVNDSLNFRVQIFDPDGRFLSQWGGVGDGSGDFSRPKGIGVDSHGHIYVVDALFDAVQIFSREGEFLLTFGERGIGSGRFWLPTGVAIDEADRIYVADSYNQRLQVFRFLRTE